MLIAIYLINTADIRRICHFSARQEMYWSRVYGIIFIQEGTVWTGLLICKRR